MAVQEILGEAFEKVANIQNTVDDIKDAIGKIENNNPMIGDLEESIGSITKIIESAQEKNISGVIIAASCIDTIIAITGHSLMIGIVFNKGE